MKNASRCWKENILSVRSAREVRRQKSDAGISPFTFHLSRLSSVVSRSLNAQPHF